MTNYIEASGKTEEAAIASALARLGLERDDVSVEILERAKGGVFGLGAKPARVKVSFETPDEPVARRPEEPSARGRTEARPPKGSKMKKPAPRPADVPAAAESVKTAPEPVKAAPVPVKEPSAPAKAAPVPVKEPSAPAKAAPVPVKEPSAPAPAETAPAAALEENGDPEAEIRRFLTGLLARMGEEASLRILEKEGGYQVFLEGEHLGGLIGHRGETLDAIQQLCSYSVNRHRGKRIRIHVDVENYRQKREEALRRLAEKVAQKVIKYRRNITLEPMNAYERHVIHEALQDYPDVLTYSTGTEPNRRTVVAYSKGKHNY